MQRAAAYFSSNECRRFLTAAHDWPVRGASLHRRTPTHMRGEALGFLKDSLRTLLRGAQIVQRCDAGRHSVRIPRGMHQPQQTGQGWAARHQPLRPVLTGPASLHARSGGWDMRCCLGIPHCTSAPRTGTCLTSHATTAMQLLYGAHRGGPMVWEGQEPRTPNLPV